MALPFRQRIFVILVALTAVPTALAVVGWALAVRTVGPSQGARVALEEMAASAREMLDHMDTTRLAPTERAALRQHLAQLSNSVSLARRAETYLRYYTGGFAAVVIVFGALALVVAVRLARHLSRQLSRPIDELVGWTRLIRRRLPLPGEGLAARGAPEFEALRQALRELATALEAARDKELEAERAGEGPPCRLLGHYERLRRAFSNLLRNAAEAMDGHGTIEIAVSRDGPGILVTIADHGRGISDELRHRVFEPYFTTKQDGTGLGLALVRQTVEAHNGSITVADTPGGGATFSIVLSAT